VIYTLCLISFVGSQRLM